MTLKNWLKETGRTASAFAAELKITPGRMSQIINGDSPGKELAKRIEDRTAGAVKRIDLLYPEEARAASQ
jgi:plasmid maintenance system antidote protein VapI